jgi:hypothetical protein
VRACEKVIQLQIAVPASPTCTEADRFGGSETDDVRMQVCRRWRASLRTQRPASNGSLMSGM